MTIFYMYFAFAAVAFIAWLVAKAFPRLAILAGIAVLARCVYYLVLAVGLWLELGFFWGTLALCIVLVPVLALAQVGMVLVNTGIGVLRGTETNIEGKYEQPGIEAVPPTRPSVVAHPMSPGARRQEERLARENRAPVLRLVAEFAIGALVLAYIYWPKK